MTAVSARGLEKRYGTVQALRGVDLDVRQGEIFGIIGPDGAGKSTLFRILTTLILADRGTACVAGLDVVKDYRAIRQKVGYMPGRFSLYQDLTVEENLDFFATIFKTSVTANYDLVRDIYIQIEPFAKRRAGALSGGMKQKLALCCALIHKPQVLFLDEPTTGVDPVSRRELWDMLDRLKTQGMAILVSTPYMDEAALCDRIALIDEGRFLVIDTPQGIVDSCPEAVWSVEGARMPQLLNALRRFPEVKSAFAFGNVHHITVGKAFDASSLKERLAGNGFPDTVIETIRPNIEDAYMLLAGK